MFRNASKSLFMTEPCSLENYGLASGACDLFLRRLAECMSVNGERHFQLAISQNLKAIALRVNDAALCQLQRPYRFARRKRIQTFHIDHRKFAPRRIRKSALWNPALQRHLAAFKSAFRGIAAAGLLPLVARARRFAELRADAASDAHFAVPRALRGLQIGKRGFDGHRLILYFHEMVDARDHAANRRRVRLLDDLIHAAKAQP